MVSMPVWMWGLFSAVVLILVSLLAWALKTIIGRAKEDITEAKNNQCPGHQKAFERVHEEREKQEDKLSKTLGDLNENIAGLKLVTQGLAMNIQSITEKHDDNKVAIKENESAITKLTERVAMVEKNIYDIEKRA
jgi:septal ring factor EnvC (AmiA/AmiB activator)